MIRLNDAEADKTLNGGGVFPEIFVFTLFKKMGQLLRMKNISAFTGNGLMQIKKSLPPCLDISVKLYTN